MLHDGDFCKIAIRVAGAGVRNSSELKKAFLHVHDGTIYLLSHVQTLDEGTEGVPMHGMRCVTQLCASSLFGSLAQIRGERLHGCEITFYQDSESIAAVHSRARRQPEARPAATEANEPEEAPAAPAGCGDFHVLGNYARNMYEGFRAYHSSHGVTMNAPIVRYSGWRIGVELETEFETGEARRQFTDVPRNWYFCESDGSLNRAGCEIITIPLMPDDAKDRATWKPLCGRLKELGATSWDNGRCGLHVHIGREILGGDEAERERNLSKLLLFYNLHLNNNDTSLKVFGRARCYHERTHDQTQELA